jgi:hypothetical protein
MGESAPKISRSVIFVRTGIRPKAATSAVGSFRCSSTSRADAGGWRLLVPLGEIVRWKARQRKMHHPQRNQESHDGCADIVISVPAAPGSRGPSDRTPRWLRRIANRCCGIAVRWSGLFRRTCIGWRLGHSSLHVGPPGHSIPESQRRASGDAVLMGASGFAADGLRRHGWGPLLLLLQHGLALALDGALDLVGNLR